MRSLRCRLGLHKPDPTHHYVNHKYRRKTIVTSRSALCTRCGKKLYKVDKFGERR